MSSNLTDQTSSLEERTILPSAQSLSSSKSSRRPSKRSSKPAQNQPSATSQLEANPAPEVPQALSTQRLPSKSSRAYTSATPRKPTTDPTGRSSNMPNPQPQMKSRAKFVKEEPFSRNRSQRRGFKRPRVSEESFRYELERIQDGNMSCQLCRRHVRCAEANDGEYSVRCCFSCARKWSVETSKKVDYYELVGDRIIEIDQYRNKVLPKKPIMITPTTNPYSLFNQLNGKGLLKILGVSKQKWSELDDSKKKMYELLLKLMTANQDSE